MPETLAQPDAMRHVVRCSPAIITFATPCRYLVVAGKLGTAAGMLRSEFCLVPKGDTPTSSRLFTAIACGIYAAVLLIRIGY